MHLSRLFQRSVSMHATRPALASGQHEAITYETLDIQVQSIARWLRQDLGLNRGDRVTLAMQNCAEYAVGLLALWTAGLCAVPVNNKLHPKEIAYILENSESRLCLSTEEMIRQLTPLIREDQDLSLIDVRGQAWQQALTQPSMSSVQDPASKDELAWLFYTSGTTGKPKGVMLTHENLVFMALNFHADVLSIDEHDVLIHAAPMSHGGGLCSVAYLLRGGLQVVPESGGFNEAELFGLLNHYQKASLFAAPTIVARMVQYADGLCLADTHSACPGLRCLITGGAPFYAKDIKAAVRCFGPRIAQMYGQGETPLTISAISASRISQAVDEDDEQLLASVGFPYTTVDINIRDDNGDVVPTGTLGEVSVHSPTVMLGYWNNPAATEQTIRDGELRTGDVGFIDERGLLHLRDRSKDVIISGGSNIYPREVEEALLCHPGVKEVSVIGTPDAEWGESVTAVVVAETGYALDGEMLDAVCLQSIARFKRPKHYIFAAALPKNATGKVLKSELRESFISHGR